MARSTYTWNNAKLNEQEVAQVLWQAGFRDMNVIAQLIPIAMRESGGKAGVHGSDKPQGAVSGDRGLFQINYTHDDALKKAGIIKKSEDLFDPVINAKAAYYLSGGGNPQTMLQLWGLGKDASGRTTWMGTKGTLPKPNIAAAQQAQASGLLGQPYQFNGATSADYAAGAANAGANANAGHDAQWNALNAWTDVEEGYIGRNVQYNNDLLNQALRGLDLQGQEINVNEQYQNALYDIFSQVNDAASVFNSREYENLTKNLARLNDLAGEGMLNQESYWRFVDQHHQDVLAATTQWLGNQRGWTEQDYALASQAIENMINTEGAKWQEINRLTGAERDLAERERDITMKTAGEQFGQALDKSAFHRAENSRAIQSQATSAGSMLARGTGQALSAEQQQQRLANREAQTVYRDLDEGSQLQLDRQIEAITQAYNTGQISYQDAQWQAEVARGNAQLNRDRTMGQWDYQQTQADQQARAGQEQAYHSYYQQYNQYAQYLENLNYQGQQGQLSYDKTANDLWARVQEMAAQHQYNQQMRDVSRDALGNQRDTTNTQANQAHFTLLRQMEQNRWQQTMDQFALEAQRRTGATDSLYDINPFLTGYTGGAMANTGGGGSGGGTVVGSAKTTTAKPLSKLPPINTATGKTAAIKGSGQPQRQLYLPGGAGLVGATAF